MRKMKMILATMLMGMMVLTTVTSCEKVEAVIHVNPGGDDGDVTGNGGSVIASHDWTNSHSRAELNMDITSTSGGSFQIIVEDADGNEVLNETLVVGVGDDSITKCSSSGTAGTWKVTIELTDFNGDGSFTLNQGC